MTDTLPARTGESGAIAPREYNVLKQQARDIASSGLAPRSVNTAEKVLVIALKGRELGIPPMQALSHIHIVEGKPTISAELMTALVRRAGHKLRVKEWTDEQCVLEGIRADDPEHVQTTSFTVEDARAAGLLNKNVWKSYRPAMLFSRCVSKACRSQFADVLMGASYVPEELGAEVNADGQVIDAEPVEDDSDRVSQDRVSHHEELLKELADKYEQLPEEARPDTDREKMFSYASSKIGNARKALQEMDARLEAALRDQPEASPGEEEEAEEAEAVVEKQTDKDDLPATRKQLNFLEALIVDQLDDGVEEFEEIAGKPPFELTRGEASEWIGRLSGRSA